MQAYSTLLPLTPNVNAERLAQLKQLMPDLFTNEGKLNPDEVRKLAEPDGIPETERYEFRWFGKTQAKRNAFTPSNATLMLDEKRSFLPNKEEEPRHLIIEGENLEVLKLLLAGYREKVKCIYIDPPYNTGKDFVYSDNYTEGRKPYWEQTGVTDQGVKIDTNTDSDGRYHSNWLNMMYSRLLLARQLLKEDGIIFISIDDNEVGNLRKLCDEVLGEENFIEQIIWKKRYGGGAKEKYLVNLHEYVLMYAKNKEILEAIFVPNNKEFIDKYYTRKDEKYDKRGPYRTQPLEAAKSMGERKNLVYDIEGPNGVLIKPKRQWLWSRERTYEAMKNNDLEFSQDKNGNWGVNIKQYLHDDEGNEKALKPTSVIDGIYTQHGTKEIENIFGVVDYFSYPKPSALIKELLKLGLGQDEIILDFFGGSGTTGQAVMELNEEDGGSRQFVLVQLPEAIDEDEEAYKAGYKKISDITIERNRRVVKKLLAARQEKAATLFDGEKPPLPALGFKVYKLRKSNFPRTEWTPDPAKSDEENLATLQEYIRLKESQLVTMFNKRELMTEILLKQGFTLHFTAQVLPEFGKNEVYLITEQTPEPASQTKKGKAAPAIEPKQVLLCLEGRLENETLEYLRTHADRKFICLERALDTTKKWNLKHYLGDNFFAF